MAHEQDITLNQLVENILRKYLDEQDVGSENIQTIKRGYKRLKVFKK